jgi:hypothetical protein
VGLFDRSSSTTQNLTEQQTAFTVADGGSSSITQGDGGFSTVVNYDLSTEALSRAADVAEAAAYGSAVVANRVTDQAAQTIGRGFDFTRGTLSDALGFADSSQRGSMDLIRSALGLATTSLQTGTQAARDASTLAVRAYDDQAQTASGNRTLVLAALAVAGLVAFSILRK